jgi:O-acetyl-ADP-ribose deacetylase (regulator of RNase III)
VPATEIALETAREFLEVPENREKTDRIVFVVYEQKDIVVYRDLIPIYFPLARPKGETTLEELETWAIAGPKLVGEGKGSKFPVNVEINSKLSFWMRGDSTKLAVDAIVNATNEYLTAGGGISKVIHGAAGPQLAAECKRIGFTATGKAVKTKGYNLIAKWVIHAVGPTREDPEALRSVYREILGFIDGAEIRSVGLCCISTGVFGYPIVAATEIALGTVREFLEVRENREKTDRIVFAVFEQENITVYCNLIPAYFPVPQLVVYPTLDLPDETAPK